MSIMMLYCIAVTSEDWQEVFHQTISVPTEKGEPMLIDMLLIIAIVMAVAFRRTWWEDNR